MPPSPGYQSDGYPHSDADGVQEAGECEDERPTQRQRFQAFKRSLGRHIAVTVIRKLIEPCCLSTRVIVAPIRQGSKADKRSMRSRAHEYYQSKLRQCDQQGNSGRERNDNFAERGISNGCRARDLDEDEPRQRTEQNGSCHTERKADQICQLRVHGGAQSECNQYGDDRRFPIRSPAKNAYGCRSLDEYSRGEPQHWCGKQDCRCPSQYHAHSMIIETCVRKWIFRREPRQSLSAGPRPRKIDNRGRGHQRKAGSLLTSSRSHRGMVPARMNVCNDPKAVSLERVHLRKPKPGC